MGKFIKFEVWQEYFNFYIRAYREKDWIGETIATIPFDSEDQQDIEEKREVVHRMVDALNHKKDGCSGGGKDQVVQTADGGDR